MGDGIANGSPYVDNPHAALQEAGRVRREMVRDACRPRFESLVDMDTFLEKLKII